MKKLLLLLLLTAGVAAGQVQTLDLGPRGRLNFYLLGDWKVNTTRIADQITLTLEARGAEVNAAATIAVTFPDQDRYDSKGRLKLRVEADCHSLAEQSVEGKAFAREFSLTTGYGFYCSFTDASLRGKPPEKGNYKVISVGRIRVMPDILVDVSLMADSFRDAPYQQLLGAIEGMEFQPGRGR